MDDIFKDLPFGKVAINKMGNVPDNFKLFNAELIEDCPGNIKVTGAEFREAKTGPRKGQLVIEIHNTRKSVIVTKEETEAYRWKS